ncbi:MAG: biopolymer transporter ExbD [Helicobacter sp.]|nr:biopolymer transporter ExbD [Helicobacter sp.]
MKKIDGLNLVPFIDIMLVLLVIVLTTASFVQTQKVRVSIPEVTKGQSEKSTQKSLNITITKDGQYFLDNKRIEISDLRAQLSGVSRDSEILLNGDKNSNLDSFIQIFNTLQDQGFSNVFVLVDGLK